MRASGASSSQPCGKPRVGARAIAATTETGGAQTSALPVSVGHKAAAKEPSSEPWFSEQEAVKYRCELLNWYDHNHRVLPWRRTPHSKKVDLDAAAAGNGSGEDSAVCPAPAGLPQQQFAYWVWVSEVMLQQTQVATVIPYFKRWVAKWPTVADLAAADIDTVNALWAGLGYYRRARYLLDGARYVVEKLDGKFPTTAPELLKIPGVGPYTSAAVASIAFGSPAAAVDGNVIRVVSRLRTVPGDPTKLAATHSAIASELLDRQRPGCYNQALMELGATVCRPVNPDCGGCPVRSVCRAAAEWEGYLAAGGAPDVEDAPRVTQYPGRKAVKEKREQAVAVTVLEVICTSQAPAAAPAAGAGAPSGKKPSAPTEAAAAARPPAQAATAQPARKRQRTMQDFALAAAARKQQQEQVTGAAAAAGDGADNADGSATPAPAAGQVDLEALVARGARHYLLTMRPQGGLLAGLWEFPGAIIETDAANGEGDDDDDDADEQDKDGGSAPKAAIAERQRLSDSLLRRLLGPEVALEAPGAAASAVTATPRAAAAAEHVGGSASSGAAPHTLRVLARHDMGQYVHVFSHIRQTNYVQRVTAVFHGDLTTLEQLTRAGTREAATAADATAASVAASPEGGSEEDAVEVVAEAEAEGKAAGKRKGQKQQCGGAAKQGQRRGKTAGGKRQQSGAVEPQVEGAETAAPSVMWVSRQQIEGPGLGLSSGVRKIFQQAVGGSDGARAGGVGRGRSGATSNGVAGKTKGAGAEAGGKAA